MRRHKYQKRCCFLLLLIFLALSGCRAGQEKAGETAAADSANAEEKSRLVGYEQLFDRSLVEGKMAAYFLCPASESVTWQNTTYGGDCTLFILPDGTTALVDCGTIADGPTIVWKLQKLGVKKLDYFILSHGHGDHIGGFRILSRYFEIGHIYVPPEDSNDYYNVQGRTFWEIVDAKKIPYTYLSAGDTFTLGEDVNVKVFNPEIGLSPMVSKGMNLNEASLVLRLSYKNSSFLMTGDIGNNSEYGRLTEEELVAKYGSELASDVCKAGHHGSDKVKGSNIWKETVNAKIYTFTTAYMRSEIEWFKYVRTGAQVFSGALDGDVLIYTSGDGTYDVQVSKERTSNYYGAVDMKDGHLKVK